MTEKQARKILDKPEWIDGLETMKCYRRKEDDSPDGFISVTMDTNGDAWISTNGDPNRMKGCDSLRFRVPMCGGGMSRRVRKAIMLLAVAIKMDNEEDSSRRM